MHNLNGQGDGALLQERDRRARAVLGVAPAADMEEIRRAFRKQSLACHPDTNPNDQDAARRFRLVCCAYKFLVEGDMCPEIEQASLPSLSEADAERCLDNDWAYWCWWREKFFEKDS
ncbi:MAG: J domain-containing protein [Verrucomicrobia bacterium]|nr:J domain-containing protein [Verrucomicrobiota bacterium]